MTENRAWIDDSLLVIYWDSDRASAGDRDIWVASRGDPSLPFDPPRPVVELNTSASEQDVWLSADQRTIYFASDRYGTLDLFVTTR